MPYPGLVGRALEDDLEDDNLEDNDNNSRALVGLLQRDGATTNGAANLARASSNRDKLNAGEDGPEGPRLCQQ